MRRRTKGRPEIREASGGSWGHQGTDRDLLCLEVPTLQSSSLFPPPPPSLSDCGVPLPLCHHRGSLSGEFTLFQDLSSGFLPCKC